ncbi:MAG TPA: DUF559 domain-containing protein [Pyrinomonadaceae bacterium]|nr:DUF559 domain-containing protein [Pyrinomonadaceae bacterium]
MKINIIGGGPAGLYFAILMKKSNPSHQITIYERNGPNDTFGWGVVFSGKTLKNLREADEETHAGITKEFEAWDNVDVVHRDTKISVRGNSFSGISRLQLLKILQQRCEQLGIELQFKTEINDVESLRSNCDLLVAADGVNSTVRKQYSDHLRPTLDVRPNRYIWYGTRQLFHGLTLTFRENETGVLAAHSYKFNKTTSTFIVECDEQTWNQSGFAELSDADTRARVAEVFAKDLDGAPLLSNNSKWINFLLVKNSNWSFENIVLLGDALHTAHFSIGSGTKLAMEDAIALYECFQQSNDVAGALSRFESTRRPVIEEYQAAAYESMLWFENARNYMHLSPPELALSLMTRSGRVSYEDLRRRDPGFISKYEKALSNCFLKETRVKTENGWKPIEAIRKGERVWTHRGRLRDVVGVQKRPHVGRIIGISIDGSSAVWATPDQLFLTPSPQAERGQGGEVTAETNPTPNPSPLAGRGINHERIHWNLGGAAPRLAELARDLRRDSTAAEKILWECLRRRQLLGLKFRRQHPLGPNYIADFYCAEARLAVELDGSIHDSDRSHWADGIRHRQIQLAGVRVLRFRNERVVNDLEGVLKEIGEYLSATPNTGVGQEWRLAHELKPGDLLVINELGETAVIQSVDYRVVNETVFDLTVDEDHSFVTEAGVAHNNSGPSPHDKF